MDNKPSYIARQPIETKSGETVWRTIGAGFRKENGVISVALDSLPLSGQIVLVEPKDAEEASVAE